MQHIGIQVQDLKGHIFKTNDINFAEILKTVYIIQDSKIKFPWLMSVDPYGDTLFNSLQIVYLTNELNNLADTLNDDLNKKVSSLISFLKMDIKPHQFVVFIGD